MSASAGSRPGKLGGLALCFAVGALLAVDLLMALRSVAERHLEARYEACLRIAAQHGMLALAHDAPCLQVLEAKARERKEAEKR